MLVRILLGLFLIFQILTAKLFCQDQDYGEYYQDGNVKEKSQAVQSFSYYEDPGKKGWWWYEPPVTKKDVKLKSSEVKKSPDVVEKKEEIKKEEPKKEPLMKTQEEELIKPLEEYTYEELLYMHPKQFSKLLDHYLEKAVGEPTEQNVYYYFNLVDVARKKAALFSSTYQYVANKYAQYLPTTVYPYTVPGISARMEMQSREIEKYVIGMRDRYGLIVFVRPDCPYCEAQLRILDRAVMDGINIKVVDITSEPVSVSKFGIEIVPTIVFVHRASGNFITIASGVTSLDNIYYAISKALQIFELNESPGRYGIYEFQKGTPLDPFEPPPLWRNKTKTKKEGGE